MNSENYDDEKLYRSYINNDNNENYNNTVMYKTDSANDPFIIKHRKRTSKKQLELLEKTFETCIRPDSKTRKKLGDQLNMTPRAVQIWFQNRRAKIKKLNGEYKSNKKKTIKKSKKDSSYYTEEYPNKSYYENDNSNYKTGGLYGDIDFRHHESQYEGTYYQPMYEMNKHHYDLNQYNEMSHYNNQYEMDNLYIDPKYSMDHSYKNEMYGSMTNPYYYSSTTYNYTDENNDAYANVDDYYYKMQQNNGYYYCDESKNENREDFVDRRED